MPRRQEEIPVPGNSGQDPYDYNGVYAGKDAFMGDWFEQSRTVPMTPLQALMETEPHDLPVESVLESVVLREAIADISLALTQEHRYIINAKISEGLSKRELADRLGVKGTQAHRLTHAAYDAFRRLLLCHPLVQEKLNMHPTCWEDAAEQSVDYIYVLSKTHLPAPFDLTIAQGKEALRNWHSDPNGVTEAIETLGATALHTLMMNNGKLNWREEITELLIERHHKYGPGNILQFEHMGLIVRMSDKVARIDYSTGEDFDDETYIDAYMDLVGYAAIGNMLDNNTFNLPFKENQ